MHFLIYPTERCNLQCKYCDTPEERKKLVMDRTYSTETLKTFLRNADNPSITFYGGEPTLDPCFIQEIMDSAKFSYISIVTNSFYLNNVPIDCLKRMHMVSISIDGTKQTTDRNRGQGVYDKVIEQAKRLKQLGYRNSIAARMTITLGTDIEKEVKHLIDTGLFDTIHWQLDVFHEHSFNKPKEYKEWFDNMYNPGVRELVKYWTKHTIENKEAINIVPFTGIMHTLLTNSRINNLRCGAGHEFWIISTTGEIYPCPVMRDDKNFRISDITKPAKEIKPQFLLKSPCTECEVFNICGGRCLYTNIHARNLPIFDIVCDSVKYLIFTLRKAEPVIRRLIEKGSISLKDFQNFYEHEVIP